MKVCQSHCGEEEIAFVICPTPREALETVKKEERDEVIVVIGSLYLVGEIKQVSA